MGYLNQYLKFPWIQKKYFTPENIQRTSYDSRICDDEDVGENLAKYKILYLCPPEKDMVLKGQIMEFPHWDYDF